VLSRCEGDPRAKDQVAHCSAEVAGHEAVEYRVDGGVGVPQQQGKGEQLYVLVDSQVEQYGQHVVRQPAEGEQHSQQQQDSRHASPLPDESRPLRTRTTGKSEASHGQVAGKLGEVSYCLRIRRVALLQLVPLKTKLV
jgi:hypothetical protein